MAKITTTSLLTSTEVTIDVATKTVKLNVAGNLSTDGVALRTLYAYLKLQWKASSTYISYAFPVNAITDTKFDFVNGWDFKDVASRNLVRDAGWAIKNPADNTTSYEEWMSFNTVGAIAATDQVYYTQGSAAGAATGTATTLAGPVNTPIKIYGDSTHGNFDYRTSFSCYVRTQGKTYDQTNIAAIGVATLTYAAYFFPLSTAADTNVATTDAVIDANATYTGMSITYSTTAITRTINGTAYNFNWIIAANGASRYKVYEYVQRQLRKTTNINAGSAAANPSTLGTTTAPLLKFAGSQLITSTGVYIDNLAATEGDFIDFYDATATKRNLPYQAAGTIFFNDVLKNDANAIYRVYFSSGFDSSSAVLVNDATGAPLSGTVGGAGSVTFSFDYDSNVQGGRTAGTDATVTLVAIGLTSGTYTRTTAVIGRNIVNNIYLAASVERNYYTS